MTLTGQLIDTSGTMSGGGTHVARGAMSAKLAADVVQPAVLQRYERESEEDARAFETTQADLRRFESESEGFERKGPQIKTSLQKIDMELNTLSKRIEEAAKRVKELK